MSSVGVGRRYLFGRNEQSAALAMELEIDGFVDDFALDPVWQGKPVLKGEAIPHDALLVNCSFSIRPVSASRRIRELRPEGALEYADLMAVSPERIPAPEFVVETRKDFHQNRTRWETLLASFADDESRQVLTDLLKFRMSGDVQYMKSYVVRLQDQYFEPFMNLSPNPVFADCGGFDGDTTAAFCSRYPDYGKVFLFEPSVANLQKARIRLNNIRAIELIEKGLSDHTGLLAFNPEAGAASAISESGACQIQMTTLKKSANAFRSSKWIWKGGS